MRIGHAEYDITPPLGVDMVGYGAHLGRKAKGVNDPLMCRAVTFEGDGSACVLVQLDLCGLTECQVARFRERIGCRTGLPPAAVMFHCSHTHSGPTTLELRGMGTPDPNYLLRLETTVSDAVGEALGRSRVMTECRQFHVPCRNIGFNRTKQGSIIDHHLRGVCFEREGDRPVLMLHHSCHPVVLGVNDELSADYPGGVAREMAAWGFKGVYLNGPCGDIDPLSNAARWGAGTMETVRIYGLHLASHGFRALEEAQECMTEPPAFASRVISLPASLPDRESVLETQREAREKLGEDPCHGRSRIADEWAGEMLEAIDSPEPPTEVPAELQAISLGGVVLLALPGEVFTEIGLEIADAFPQRRVLVLNTSNAVVSYIPTADEFAEDSYAASSSFMYYRSLPLRKGAGELLAEEAIKLVREIAG